MMLTNNSEIYKQTVRLRTHEISSDSEYITLEPDGPWYYEQVVLGFNFSMTNIHLTLGLSQQDQLDEFAKRDNKLAKRNEKGS